MWPIIPNTNFHWVRGGMDNVNQWTKMSFEALRPPDQHIRRQEAMEILSLSRRLEAMIDLWEFLDPKWTFWTQKVDFLNPTPLKFLQKTSFLVRFWLQVDLLANLGGDLQAMGLLFWVSPDPSLSKSSQGVTRRVFFFFFFSKERGL